MQFVPFVLDGNENIIPVKFTHMNQDDANATNEDPKWQTSWTSEYIKSLKGHKIALKSLDDELLALAVYKDMGKAMHIYIAYMEAQPESNPNCVTTKKYHNIGRVLIAYGIKLSVDALYGGDVTLEAKTPELAKHYMQDFEAIPVGNYEGVAPRFLICGAAAKNIFSTYLK